MARFPLRAVDGPAGTGFELDGHGIFWPYDDEQPFMTVRAADGSELRRRVENPAFHVAVGGRDRRTRMKAAALEFFAPLLDEGER